MTWPKVNEYFADMGLSGTLSTYRTHLPRWQRYSPDCPHGMDQLVLMVAAREAGSEIATSCLSPGYAACGTPISHDSPDRGRGSP
jgi:hypothetical protein